MSTLTTPLEGTLQDLDFELVCQVRIVSVERGWFNRWRATHTEDPCGEPATGWLVCRGCGFAYLSCSEHARSVLMDDLMQCSRCGIHGPGAEILRFEPLPSKPDRGV